MEYLRGKHVIAPLGWHCFIDKMVFLPDGSTVAAVVGYEDLEEFELEQVEGKDEDSYIQRLHYSLGDLRFVIPDGKGGFNVMSFEQMEAPTNADEDTRDLIFRASMVVKREADRKLTIQSSDYKLWQRMEKWLEQDKRREGK